MRPLPEPGQIWRHCSGSEFAIVAVAPAAIDIHDGETHSSTDGTGESFTAISPIAQGELAVWYRGDNRLWVRAIGSFLAVLGDGLTHYHRFELVQK